MKSKSISALLCILLLLCTAVLPAAASDAAAELLSGIASHRMAQSGADSVQEWIDGELTEHAGITSEWYILALSQSRENYDFSGYSSALRRYLAENNITSASTRQKYALLLLATGCEDGYISETLADSIGQQGLMSWVFGLHLLHNSDAATPFTQEQVIGEILSLQLADGGFAITGNKADADVTA
ncbi:MAG: surface/cell-adhesion protein, partial [Oscillospiraceae bacterium]|nr:surface/cell-adhesion protein [Oscillospiraceae bacterium]